MKKGKKPSLAMQIFIALVLAILCGLALQGHSELVEHYIKPHYFHAGYQEGRIHRFEDRGLLSLYDSFCGEYRSILRNAFSQIFSNHRYNGLKL